MRSLVFKNKITYMKWLKKIVKSLEFSRESFKLVIVECDVCNLYVTPS